MLQASLNLQLDQRALDALLKPHRIDLDLPVVGSMQGGQIRVQPQAGALELDLSFVGGQGLTVVLQDQGLLASSQVWTLRVSHLGLRGFVGAGLLGLAKPALLALAVGQLDRRLPGIVQPKGDRLQVHIEALVQRLVLWPPVVSALAPWGAKVGGLQVQTVECRHGQLSVELRLLVHTPE